MSPLAVGEDDQELCSTNHSGRINVRCWLISVVVHTGIVVLLWLWILPHLERDTVQVLEGSLATDDHEARQFSVTAQVFADPLSEPEEIQSPVTLPTSTILAEVTAEDLEYRDVVDPGSVEVSISRSRLDGANHSPPMQRPVSDTRAIRRSTGMKNAVGGVGDSLRAELLQGDTLIVWLLDSSNSLNDNRSALAWHARELYQSIGCLEQRSDDITDGYVLLSSVIAFGSDWQETVEPTPSGFRAIDAMKNLPIDATGKENVMSAIDGVVALYRKQRGYPQRMMVVVLTDESGDDTQGLEQTIAGCRESGVVVHVIGPTAVMGLQQGWQHRAVRQGSVNYSFWLAVNRGPETPLPERLFLPYWHQSQLPAWEQPGARAVEDGKWYGGAYRERVLSGFGPYALTRLALQTGGSYTLFDSEWRGYRDGEYALDKLRDYLPGYESTSEYLTSVSQRPLRRFVTDAAALSLEQPHLFAPPRTTFMGQRSPYYPFNVQHVHCPPTEFGSRLSAALDAERQRVRAANEQLAALIQRLQDPSIQWEQERATEESKRWRAWFDLTKGRLMATQARQLEYLAVTAIASSTLSAESNMVTLLPAESLREPASVDLVREARECLRRCIADHPGTAWQDMAQWELEHPFGLKIQQARVPRPPPGIIAGPIKTPTEFTFPSL